jgi:hypothetical protein
VASSCGQAVNLRVPLKSWNLLFELLLVSVEGLNTVS